MLRGAVSGDVGPIRGVAALSRIRSAEVTGLTPVEERTEAMRSIVGVVRKLTRDAMGGGRGAVPMSAKITEIDERYIKSWPAAERLEFLALVAQGQVDRGAQAPEEPMHSIMELHGLGKEIWEGIDAQSYVNRLRDEWERPA